MGLKDKAMTKPSHKQVWVVRHDPDIHEFGIDSIWDSEELAANRACLLGSGVIDDFLLNVPQESVLRWMFTIDIATGDPIKTGHACQPLDNTAELTNDGQWVAGYGSSESEAKERAELFRMGYLSHKPKRKPRAKKAGGAVSIQ